jgi:hypothetical protein
MMRNLDLNTGYFSELCQSLSSDSQKKILILPPSTKIGVPMLNSNLKSE